MANKLTTIGYFVKRMRDSGYVVDKLFNRYGYTDPRSWSIVIDPGNASVICTCYQNDPNLGCSYFELYDGGQFIPKKFNVDTNSIEVIITYLVKYGINAKSYNYTNRNNMDDNDRDNRYSRDTRDNRYSRDSQSENTNTR